jgi:hypothetical protein
MLARLSVSPPTVTASTEAAAGASTGTGLTLSTGAFDAGALTGG